MKAIATTTINPPTKGIMAMLKIAKRDGWLFIIAGDKKTPHKPYQDIAAVEDCVTYLQPDDQEAISEELSNLIGWNCIQRRNFSMVKAWQMGAEIIAVWDDDNIPYPKWGQNVKVGQEYPVLTFKTTCPVFDPLSATHPQIWHRGFPIQLLDDRDLKGRPQLKTRKVLIQADMWDGSPDVDAICRITLNPMVSFRPSMQPFTANVAGPFNSQNTFLSREVFPTYFLFPHIGRMDDIWASYITQFQFPDSVIYSKASVYQERNPHDLVKDLKDELLGYESNELIATEPEAYLGIMPSKSLQAYEVYKRLFR